MAKLYTVGIENFEIINNAIINDASDLIANGGGVVYSRVDKESNTGVIVAGNLFSMMYGIARIINKLSEKTGVPARLIIKSISDLLEV